MGWQVRDQCYSTELAAAHASVSGEVGKVLAAGSAVYAVDVSEVTASSATLVLQPLGGGTPITQTVAITSQPCELLDAADGTLVGGLILVAWAGAFGVRYLAEIVKGN